jgi:hypothetical protein
MASTTEEGPYHPKQVVAHRLPPPEPLPQKLQDMIGQACDCCDECPPDPRISCQYDGSDPTYVTTSYIQNARKGDLILIPGGGSGVIGGLLHSLDPSQHFSHMGIMTKDFYWVRHSPGIDDRLTADEYATGSVFGQPAPLDGFTPDHVKFAWPGTLTQTVDQAYLASISANPNASGSLAKFVPCSLVDQESTQTPKNAYNIDALSFEPIFDSQADTTVFKGDASLGLPPGTVFPLVVKPCPSLETDLVRQTLNQVADAAMGIYGHYRFYSYTSAASALDPTPALGPACIMPNPNPVAAFPGSPDPWFPADGNNPPPTTVSVPFTFPTVCSSFVWLAVQSVSLHHFPASLGAPSIILDPSNAIPSFPRPSIVQGCEDELPPDWTGDPPGTRDDGLYVYDNTNRQKAAQWLNSAVKQKVVDKVQQALPGPLYTAVQTFGLAAILAAAEAGGPAGVAALLLVDSASGANIYEALYEMPNKVANQMCNAFASDYCDESSTGSSNWQNPGSISPDHLHVTPNSGSAVSPDNTMFWYPPMGTKSLAVDNLPQQIVGLYGHNERMIFRTGTFPKYSCTWQRSYGHCILQGFVKYNGMGVNGAVVYVGCKETITHSSGGDRSEPGFFSLEIPSGRYLAKATATAQNGWGLDGQTDVTVNDDSKPIEIDLQDPPPERRMITVTGSMLLTHYYLGLSSPDQKLYLFNAFPLRAEVVVEGAESSDVYSNIVTGYTADSQNMSDVGDDTSALLQIWLDAINYNHADPTDPSNLSVDGYWQFSMPDYDETATPVIFHLDKDGSYSGEGFLDTGGTFPNSAKLSFTLNNVRAP